MTFPPLFSRKEISVDLWLALWLATFLHAGSTVWAMLSTAQLPPGYKVPPQWAAFFWPGPNSFSFWIYMIVLGANIAWESWFKGQKTYVTSSFPFPDFQYSHIAMLLWTGLWGFAHFGHSQGWFSVPDKLNSTFGWCLFLGFVQYSIIEAIKNPEEFSKGFKDDPEPAKAVGPNAMAPSPKPTLAAPQPKAGGSSLVSANVPSKARKQVDSGNNDLTEKLLDYVRKNGQAKTGGLVGVLGSPRRTVIRNLNKLLAEGWLIREGSGPGAVYRLNVTPKEERLN